MVRQLKMHQEIRSIKRRLDSLSRRIGKLSQRMHGVINSNKHYIKKRLPLVEAKRKLQMKCLSSYLKMLENWKTAFGGKYSRSVMINRKTSAEMYPVFLSRYQRKVLMKILNIKPYKGKKRAWAKKEYKNES